jgi:hypothetical protein
VWVVSAGALEEWCAVWGLSDTAIAWGRGMGEVYLAQHPRLPRLDAIKILPAAFTSDEQFRETFQS